MKLTSERPYWLRRNETEIDYPAVTDDLTCQCVIVGAGVTGAMLADRLASHGFDVIVVDQAEPCTGSTSASTALLLYDIDLPLTRLAKLIGWQQAAQVYKLSYKSIDAIKQLAESLSTDVDFHSNRSIYLAENEASAQELHEETEARQAIGLSVEYHTHEEIHERFGLSGAAALSSTQAASCDPIRFSRALLDRAQRNGARLFSRTNVVEFGQAEQGVRLRTANGPRITAKHGIIACGYNSIQLIEEPIVKLFNTYALISRPLKSLEPWDREWMVWEARNPYLYMRATSDNRLLVGGEDDAWVESSVRDARIPAKMEVLHQKLRKLLPDVEWQPELGWAGTFGQTKDSLPYIGSTPELPGYLFALGFGGNGMTFSEIACQQIVRQLRGEATPDAQLFRFGR